ncbi:TetR/AcrR family transcriptional regulator C-terminal domain-containing protein [Streptomyces sp. NPDC053431]|uniref:TetR/AcrR family transcriptional regulator C-terminal domain-containing protein n=1 Tax=Streptomyces sp. NPDC053431 TaxID=3365703 RepID=UPI0037D5E7E0
MAALGDVGVDAVMPVVAAVNAYVIGAVRREIAARRAERATNLDEKRWQASLGPYLERPFATGRYPALATVVRDTAHLDADRTFRIGLDFLLDGIEAGLSR